MLIQTINFILWPSYSFIFALLIILDGISHLSIVSASLVSGNTTHKLKDEETHWLLRLYYGTHLLFTLCFCSEVRVKKGFAIVSYIGFWFKFEGVLGLAFQGFLAATAVGTFVKQVVNVVQIEHAAKIYTHFLQSLKEL
jgi:CDP-diacylglycerol--inositol 3-phosphatidyltransferase